MSSKTETHETITEEQTALDYCDAVSPLLYKQRALLKELNEEWYWRHHELKMKVSTSENSKKVIWLLPGSKSSPRQSQEWQPKSCSG